jgi:cell division protein FtsL
VKAPQARRFAFLAGSFLLITLMVVGVVVLQVLASQTSFRLEELGRRAVQLRQGQNELKLRVAQLEAPDRISKAARQLGLRLIPPERIQTITVRPGPTGELAAAPGRSGP